MAFGLRFYIGKKLIKGTRKLVSFGIVDLTKKNICFI